MYFTNPIDGSSMELVPEGTYVWGMGGKVKEISVADFYISLRPVTNGQYRRFLKHDEAYLSRQPWFNLETSLQSNKYGSDDHWIGGIAYSAAQEYCKWTRMRLLTLFELEYFYVSMTSAGRRVIGMNCGYEFMPMYWTSTMGHEIGKDGMNPVIAPVALGMDRSISFAAGSDYMGLIAGLCCAASPDMVKRILDIELP
jgi:hypothetical protein